MQDRHIIYNTAIALVAPAKLVAPLNTTTTTATASATLPSDTSTITTTTTSTTSSKTANEADTTIIISSSPLLHLEKITAEQIDLTEEKADTEHNLAEQSSEQFFSENIDEPEALSTQVEPEKPREADIGQEETFAEQSSESGSTEAATHAESVQEKTEASTTGQALILSPVAIAEQHKAGM